MNYNRQVLDTPYYTYYVIKSGDTLYKIAKDYNLNPKLIAELNGLKYDEYIYPNQTIILPKKGVQYYITKEGDTLKSVVNIFGANKEALVNQNETIYLLDGQMIFYKE
ncbi:MAG: LysM peptidoglycan-binding domain-containing protein [Bacilli bacterium]|nr:LysM peptidoglycan-binding domain-containing protein [Bacilli bacterium]